MLDLKCRLYGLENLGTVGNWKVYFPKYRDENIKYFELVDNDPNYCLFLLNNDKINLNDDIRKYLTVIFELKKVLNKLKELES